MTFSFHWHIFGLLQKREQGNKNPNDANNKIKFYVFSLEQLPFMCGMLLTKIKCILSPTENNQQDYNKFLVKLN